MFDFETLYGLYPRKIGKTSGIKRCRAQIKTQSQYDDLKKAIINYTKFVEGTEKKFIKHFSTFMNCWEDFLELEEDNEIDIRKLKTK